jgi:hypothetical protein
MARTTWVWMLSLVIACHPVAHPRPPRPPPEQRVATAIETWGAALRSGDDGALAAAEDRRGQFALVYTGTKLAARGVPGGEQAVERTLVANLLVPLLQGLWPGLFGAPTDDLFVFVPSGELGPALVAAGLAEPVDGSSLTVTAIPREATLGRVQDAAARHRARLRAGEAWTCRPVAIDKIISPTEPSLVRAAAISQHVFAGWLGDVEALWLVRARCARRPALFIVTAGHDQHGAARDRILIAVIAPAAA